MSPNINAYLTFKGNCKDAMKFYEKCTGGALKLMTFADAKMDVPPEQASRIMHANLTLGKATLMASDTMPHHEFKQGNNFSVSLSHDDVKEAERVFKALSERANVTMPMQETFWAKRFGMLTDQFGVQWMVNVDKPMG
jgi:PhnB protein